MKKIHLLALTALVTGMTGCVSVTEREIFGQPVAIVKTRDLCAPCTTSVLDKDLKPITTASGPGFVPGVAGAAGTATQGALYPRHKNNTNTSVSIDGGDVTSTGGNGNGGTSNPPGQHVPPGHVNNPSHNN